MLAAGLAIAVLPSVGMAQAADLDAGRAAFAKCRICHTIAAGAPSTVGPNLHGVFGRKAGSVPDFDYSPAIKGSGVVWNDATLAKFLRDPKTDIPGTRMAFPGIADGTTLSELIAYLRQATK